MKTVHKYKLSTQTNLINLPQGAEVLKIGLQDSVICMWVLVNPRQEITQLRTFICHGTGHDVSSKQEYIATVFDESFVWHIFEEI